MLDISSLDPKQIEAVDTCLDVKQRLVAVTGEAGTGKTSIMKYVADKLQEYGHRVALCALAGKAAKRIKEATGHEAMTIHRLLEYTKPGEKDDEGRVLEPGVPKRTMLNPLTYNVVLCDEYAMVNHEVHRNLLDALPTGAIVRVFGDRNQLRPIESNAILASQPSPFEDLLKRHRSVVLETIHRQGEGSGIVAAGRRINKGWYPVRAHDFELVVTDQPVVKLMETITRDDRAGIRYDGINNQIIVPGKRSWIGTKALNQKLMLHYHPELSDKATEIPRHDWEGGDKTLLIDVGVKVINGANWYAYYPLAPEREDYMFNGEGGIITDINEFGEITIDLGDRTVTVPPSVEVTNKYGKVVFMDPRRDLSLAYAITTHKAQGSEYEHVIYVINKSIQFMCNRQQLYTAVTRARKRTTFIGCGRSIQYGLYNTKTTFDR